MSYYKTDEKLELRVISLKGIVFQKKADAIQVRIPDGLIVINKNYSSVVEKLISCEAIIFEGKTRTNLNISDGWLVVNKNKCDLFVDFFK